MVESWLHSPASCQYSVTIPLFGSPHHPGPPESMYHMLITFPWLKDTTCHHHYQHMAYCRPNGVNAANIQLRIRPLRQFTQLNRNQLKEETPAFRNGSLSEASAQSPRIIPARPNETWFLNEAIYEPHLPDCRSRTGALGIRRWLMKSIF
ncbi:hypothetical protein CC79DRAFT_1333702 [Sarocladium strictum]